MNKDRATPVDFRLQLLGDVSSDQLFFLYYALDNCERSDDLYQARQFRAWRHLPPEYRVNLPLRHLAQFDRAFGCSATSGLLKEQFMAAPEGSRCDALRWTGNSSSDRRFSWGDLGGDNLQARSKARIRGFGK